MRPGDWLTCWLISDDAEKKIARARRMLRDAQRGNGKYTLDDYTWLVNELSKLLRCHLADSIEVSSEAR